MTDLCHNARSPLDENLASMRSLGNSSAYYLSQSQKGLLPKLYFSQIMYYQDLFKHTREP